MIKQYEINGEMWDFQKLAKHCGITIGTAKQRLQRYSHGNLSAEKTLWVGSIPTGGFASAAGTEEYRSLQDRRPRNENLVSPPPTKFDRMFGASV